MIAIVIASYDGLNSMGKTLLRFKHLKERRIVENWAQVKRWVEQQDFPPGRLLGPNTRVWTEDEINDWLDARPTTREDAAA
jgi:hypothetical protein